MCQVGPKRNPAVTASRLIYRNFTSNWLARGSTNSESEDRPKRTWLLVGRLIICSRLFLGESQSRRVDTNESDSSAPVVLSVVTVTTRPTVRCWNENKSLDGLRRLARATDPRGISGHVCKHCGKARYCSPARIPAVLFIDDFANNAAFILFWISRQRTLKTISANGYGLRGNVLLYPG